MLIFPGYTGTRETISETKTNDKSGVISGKPSKTKFWAKIAILNSF